MTILLATLCVSLAAADAPELTSEVTSRVGSAVERAKLENVSDDSTRAGAAKGVLFASNQVSTPPKDPSVVSSRASKVRSEKKKLRDVARQSMMFFVLIDILREANGHFETSTRNLHKSAALLESSYYTTAFSHHEAAIEALRTFSLKYPDGPLVLDKLVAALGNHTAMIAITFNHGQFTRPPHPQDLRQFWEVHNSLNAKLAKLVRGIAGKSQQAMHLFDQSVVRRFKFYETLSDVARLLNPVLAEAAVDLIELGEDPTMLNDILNERQAKIRELGRSDAALFPKALVEQGEELLRMGEKLKDLALAGDDEAYQRLVKRFQNVLAQSELKSFDDLLDASLAGLLAMIPSQFTKYTTEMMALAMFDTASKTNGLFERAQAHLEVAVTMREESAYTFGRADVARIVTIIEDFIKVHHALKKPVSKELLEPLKSFEKDLVHVVMPFIRGETDRQTLDEFLTSMRSLQTHLAQFSVSTSSQLRNVFGQDPKLAGAIEFYEPLSKVVRHDIVQIEMFTDKVVVFGTEQAQLVDGLKTLLKTSRALHQMAPSQFLKRHVSQAEEMSRLGSRLIDPSYQTDRESFELGVVDFLDALAAYKKGLQRLLDQSMDRIKQLVQKGISEGGAPG